MKYKPFTEKLEQALHNKVVQNNGINLKEQKPETSVNETELRQKTTAYLQKILSDVIKISPDKLLANEPFEKYGIDSLMILNLNRTLNNIFGELPKTLFFEYQSLNELSTYFTKNYKEELLKKLALDSKPAPITSSSQMSSEQQSSKKIIKSGLTKSTENTAKDVSQDIAIIGISGRYPQARNVEEFWENLKLGKNCITEIPKDRWDMTVYFDPDKNKPGKSYSKWGGFINDVDKFDPLFFNISPREAEIMDPHERLFLEIAWETLEDAGYTKRSLLDKQVGVFTGVMYGEYQLYGAEESLKGRVMATGSSYASIANRVSYYMNFHGPSIALDTMCSSSLSSIHLACKSIITGECQLAIAGGVNVSIHPNKYILLSQGKFLSSDGRCQSFGEGGDGYVPGEGVGAVLLKSLQQALLDGDHIYGVIKGSSINHGGKTNGYTVPNPNAQAAVIVNAYKNAKLDPMTISYIEAHGTGTSLGDPIEITGLNKAFGQEKRTVPCSIGSVKSNIGHCESAAGIAAVTKVLLQMKYQMLVPSLHSEILNPHINWSNTSFTVQHKLEPWKRPMINVEGMQVEIPRRTGISSFGAGGSNAHMIIEEAPELKPTQHANKFAYLITISAKSENSLKQRIIDLAMHLTKHMQASLPVELNLEDLSYTLNAGREHFEKRYALIVNSLNDFQKKLKHIIDNKDSPNIVSNLNKTDNIKDQTISQDEGNLILQIMNTNQLSSSEFESKLFTLANLYVNGGDIDWEQLHSGESKRRISLPTYPFTRKRYWFNSYSNAIYPDAVTQKSQIIKTEEASVKSIDLDIPPYTGNEVILEIINDNIAVIKMVDKNNHNMFTKNLLHGLQAKFQEIIRTPKIKVVIITGYDNVFCMGGDKDSLISISENKAKFTDMPFITKGFLECEVPVIAAIQGHAHGGGFAFGLYADVIILSEENTYSASFMKYGFTPGLGATFILKEKLGNIATEMMFTAKLFSGYELKEHTSGIIYRKQTDVLNEAISIAMSIAEKPLQAIKVLKTEMAKKILDQLPAVFESELSMHQKTFSTQQVKDKIQEVFEHSSPKEKLNLTNTKVKTTPEQEIINKELSSNMKSDIEFIHQKIIDILSKIIHLPKNEISLNSNFTDFGTDSIAGVEIIREINNEFNLNLEAQNLYTYPNIEKLSNFIQDKILKSQEVKIHAHDSFAETQKLIPDEIISDKTRESINALTYNKKTLEAKDTSNTILKNEQPVSKSKISLKKVNSQSDKNSSYPINNDSIIENYKKTFLNYDELNISFVKTSNNINIEYVSIGQGDPILLLPPLNCISTIWRNQLKELSKHHQLISIHYPGCGRSEFSEQTVSLHALGDLIIQVMNSLKVIKPFSLIGWSSGGIIALYIASRYPNHIKTLTVVNSLASYQINAELYKKDLKLLQEDFKKYSTKYKIEIAQQQIYGISANNREQDFIDQNITLDVTDMLSNIHVPTLIIAGGEDKVTPVEYSRLLNDKIDKSELYVLKSAGHYIPLFNSSYFDKKLLGFIKRSNIDMDNSIA